MQHRPTVEAGVRYWEAVRAQAIREHNHELERTAIGVRRSYEAALAKISRS